MSIDLTPRWDEFAVYLPAIQEWYAKGVANNANLDRKRPFPSDIKLRDLDYQTIFASESASLQLGS